MNGDKFKKLLALLERLDLAKIPYNLQHSRDNAVMITAFAPGEYWEIEVIDNDEIEIERYRSNGSILGESALNELFALCSDEEPAVSAEAQENDDILARK